MHKFRLNKKLRKIVSSKIFLAVLVEVGLLLIFLGWVWYQNNYSNKTLKKTENRIAVIAQKALDECSQPNLKMNKESCYSKKFINIALQNGQKQAFEVLGILQTLDQSAIGCHFISHGIGLGTYQRDPKNWQKNIREVSSSCTYGAVHGIIEAYVSSLPDRKLDKKLIPEICGEEPRADCNHIIGHLLLLETQGNIDKAVDLCQVFKEERQLHFCLTGVFMEYQTAENLIAHGYAPESWHDWPARLPELEQTCLLYQGENGVSCWEEIVHAAAATYGGDAKKVFEFCSRAPIEKGAKMCRRHGTGIIAGPSDYNFGALKDMCLLPQPDDIDFERDCYDYLISGIIATNSNLAYSVIDACATLKSDFQHRCYSMVGAVLRDSQAKSKEEIDKICKRAPSEEFFNNCNGTQISDIPRNAD